MGKQASEHGVTASIRYFSKKYPQLSLKETTVGRLKNLYRSMLKSKLESKKLNGDSEGANGQQVLELHHKKTG